eukprot:TRINITY_DN8776_c0_g2_i2.p1 TRINITY_DN8776_c0_g2~~TRINITY_DN8776_c0_g2_i2.p1  ORF type:complete len:574 (-),score=115.12 TRINITY_DN8776_c0_g2_i2:1501-3222(-)
MEQQHSSNNAEGGIGHSKLPTIPSSSQLQSSPSLSALSSSAILPPSPIPISLRRNQNQNRRSLSYLPPVNNHSRSHSASYETQYIVNAENSLPVRKLNASHQPTLSYPLPNTYAETPIQRKPSVPTLTLDPHGHLFFKKDEFWRRFELITSNLQTEVPDILYQSLFWCLLTGDHLLVDLKNNDELPRSQGWILSQIVPSLIELTCSYISCSSTTSTAELSKAFFGGSFPAISSVRSSSALGKNKARTQSLITVGDSLDENSQRVPLSTNGKKNASVTQCLIVENLQQAPTATKEALYDIITERRLAFKGFNYNTPSIFLVIVVENKITNDYLPNYILDKFLAKIPLTKELYPPSINTSGIFTVSDILSFRKTYPTVYIGHEVQQYIRSIVIALRNHPWIIHGPTPLATSSLENAAKVEALLNGQKFVTPTHVMSVCAEVLNHRVILHPMIDPELPQPHSLKSDLSISSLTNSPRVNVSHSSPYITPNLSNSHTTLPLYMSVPHLSLSTSAIKQPSPSVANININNNNFISEEYNPHTETSSVATSEDEQQAFDPSYLIFYLVDLILDNLLPPL